jgi:hypothetical protein
MPGTIRRHFPLMFPTMAAVKAYTAGILVSEPEAQIVGLERVGEWWAACLSTPKPLGLNRGLAVREVPGRRCACSLALARRLRG